MIRLAICWRRAATIHGSGKKTLNYYFLKGHSWHLFVYFCLFKQTLQFLQQIMSIPVWSSLVEGEEQHD